MNFNQENLKNITTNNKGTKASWDNFRERQQVSQRRIQKAIAPILHIRELEELICNKLLKYIFGIGES
jgi:hypothetical protein